MNQNSVWRPWEMKARHELMSTRGGPDRIPRKHNEHIQVEWLLPWGKFAWIQYEATLHGVMVVCSIWEQLGLQ